MPVCITKGLQTPAGVAEYHGARVVVTNPERFFCRPIDVTRTKTCLLCGASAAARLSRAAIRLCRLRRRAMSTFGYQLTQKSNMAMTREERNEKGPGISSLSRTGNSMGYVKRNGEYMAMTHKTGNAAGGQQTMAAGSKINRRARAPRRGQGMGGLATALPCMGERGRPAGRPLPERPVRVPSSARAWPWARGSAARAPAGSA